MIARGSIAGFICIHAQNAASCLSLVIQTHEVLAAHSNNTTNGKQPPIFKRLWQSLRVHHYKILEYATYNRKYTKPHVNIEAASPAIKVCLIETYDADPYRITVAPNGITYPPIIDELRDYQIEE